MFLLVSWYPYCRVCDWLTGVCTGILVSILTRLFVHVTGVNLYGVLVLCGLSWAPVSVLFCIFSDRWELVNVVVSIFTCCGTLFSPASGVGDLRPIGAGCCYVVNAVPIFTYDWT